MGYKILFLIIPLIGSLRSFTGKEKIVLKLQPQFLSLSMDKPFTELSKKCLQSLRNTDMDLVSGCECVE